LLLGTGLVVTDATILAIKDLVSRPPLMGWIADALLIVVVQSIALVYVRRRRRQERAVPGGQQSWKDSD
jgi:hypothetical protein